MATTVNTGSPRSKKTTAVAAAYGTARDHLNGVDATTPAQRVARDKNRVAIASAAKKTPETVVKTLGDLKLTVAEAIDSVSNSFVQEIASLREIQTAIKAETENLQNLHAITADADTLQALIVAQQQQKEAFDDSIAETRAQWDEDKKAHAKAEAEYRTETAKQRKWEGEQYNYETNKTRKAEQDAWTAQLDSLKKSVADEIAAQNADLAARAKVVADQETEIVKIRAELAKVEETTKSAVDKAVAIATNSLKKDLEYKFTVEKLDLNNSINLKNAEITSLNARIVDLAKTNNELDTKYKQASDKVQAIAEKAIEGASKQQVVFQTPNGDASDNRRSK